MPLVIGDGVQFWPRLSPDGRFVAYVSGETGQEQVYVKRFPSGEGKWQVSLDGGFWPRWSPRGDRIYYAADLTLMEVDVALQPDLRLGQPRALFTRKELGWPILFNWPPGFDVSPDGGRFLICQPVEQERPDPGFVVVQNWHAEFARSD